MAGKKDLTEAHANAEAKQLAKLLEEAGELVIDGRLVKAPVKDDDKDGETDA